MKASDFAGWLVVTAEANAWQVNPVDLGSAFPALTFCRGEELFFAHVKAVSKPELTSAQAAWQSALRETGAEAVCWTPSDMEAAYSRLTQGASPQWNGQRSSSESSEPVS